VTSPRFSTDVGEDPGQVHARITTWLLQLCPPHRADPPTYVRRHLADHADAGNVLDGRVLNPHFLPYTDPARLRAVLNTRTIAAEIRRSVLPGLLFAYRRTTHRWNLTDPAANYAALSFWAAAHGTPLPAEGTWSTRWAHWALGSSEILAQQTAPVMAVATAVVGGRVVAVTGSHDKTVRVWDLATGALVGDPLIGHTRSVMAVATAVVGGRWSRSPARMTRRCGCGIWPPAHQSATG
jgi:hypothetical protein